MAEMSRHSDNTEESRGRSVQTVFVLWNDAAKADAPICTRKLRDTIFFESVTGDDRAAKTVVRTNGNDIEVLADPIQRTRNDRINYRCRNRTV